jgi:hypothetical protein
MTPLARAAGIAASVVLAATVLAGCTDPGPTEVVDDGFALTPDPTKSADDGALPAGSAIDEWAAAALPADKPGGAGAVSRASGEVSPGTDAIIDLAQPEGQWQLTIVCQSADGSAMTLIPAPVETNELQPLQCAAPDGTALRGDLGSISFSGGSGHTLTLRTTVRAIYAYAITPQSAPQD